jgi:predicted unusual protein kinase regulating ubiquinone biosynthesis (AarF/ABC1/UbiB family)
MVTRLSESDQNRFFELVWSVLKGDKKSCTELIRSLSTIKLDPKVDESLTT